MAEEQLAVDGSIAVEEFDTAMAGMVEFSGSMRSHRQFEELIGRDLSRSDRSMDCRRVEFDRLDLMLFLGGL